jgi:hypothetical protein
MKELRQNYKDATLQDATRYGCDVFQLKYDGWWSRNEIRLGVGTVYSDTNRELTKFGFHTPANPLTTDLIGELMHGTNWAQKEQLKGKCFLFDIWHLNGEDLEAMPYRDRYSLLKTVTPFLPPQFIRVPNFPISQFASIWQTFVTDGDYEGVVFRKSQGKVGDTLYRMKATVTDEYECTGFEQGEGKFEGTLGSILARTKYGNNAKVGGGLSNEQRREIWDNPKEFLGRWFEVEGKKRFEETGLLRHPNFVRWKGDSSRVSSP